MKQAVYHGKDKKKKKKGFLSVFAICQHPGVRYYFLVFSREKSTPDFNPNKD
jgi:hypothetical protein